MAPEPSTATGEATDTKAKDAVASVCGQIANLPTGDRAALRRLFLTRSEAAAGIVTGLLIRAGVPEIEWRDVGAFNRWRLLAHVAAVLSGTAAVSPHRPGPDASLGRALHAAGYSDHHLMRLTSAQGPALEDQIVRAARVLASAGQVPLDLRTLRSLSFDITEAAEKARLSIARDYYYAAHQANTKGTP